MSMGTEDPRASGPSEAKGFDDRASGEAKHERDRYPDTDERPEYPEQKRGFPDRKPGELGAIERELAPAADDSAGSPLDHLDTRRGTGIVGDPIVGVTKHCLSLILPCRPTLVFSHEPSVPLVHCAEHDVQGVTR